MQKISKEAVTGFQTEFGARELVNEDENKMTSLFYFRRVPFFHHVNKTNGEQTFEVKETPPNKRGNSIEDSLASETEFSMTLQAEDKLSYAVSQLIKLVHKVKEAFVKRIRKEQKEKLTNYGYSEKIVTIVMDWISKNRGPDRRHWGDFLIDVLTGKFSDRHWLQLHEKGKEIITLDTSKALAEAENDKVVYYYSSYLLKDIAITVRNPKKMYYLLSFLQDTNFVGLVPTYIPKNPGKEEIAELDDMPIGSLPGVPNIGDLCPELQDLKIEDRAEELEDAEDEESSEEPEEVQEDSEQASSEEPEDEPQSSSDADTVQVEVSDQTSADEETVAQEQPVEECEVAEVDEVQPPLPTPSPTAVEVSSSEESSEEEAEELAS